MPRHTPGPWRQGRTGGCVVADSEHATHKDQEYYGGNLVCESIHSPNIPIICAAPELLTLLRQLATRLRNAGQLTPDLINAEALIAKLAPHDADGEPICQNCGKKL